MLRDLNIIPAAWRHDRTPPWNEPRYKALARKCTLRAFKVVVKEVGFTKLIGEHFASAMPGEEGTSAAFVVDPNAAFEDVAYLSS
jgi:hypothetical protein